MFVLIYFSSICFRVNNGHLIVDNADVGSRKFGSFLYQSCQFRVVGPYGTRPRRNGPLDRVVRMFVVDEDVVAGMNCSISEDDFVGGPTLPSGQSIEINTIIKTLKTFMKTRMLDTLF